jgi:hypothetical protein
MTKRNHKDKIDPKVKDILVLLGAGSFLAASVVFPGLPLIAKGFIKSGTEDEKWKKQKDWDKYNLWRLKQVLKRMHTSKYIEVIEKDDVPIVRISEKGKQRLLQYDVESFSLDKSSWDGKWRLIVYDVVSAKRQNSEQFRRAINKLNLLKLQKSVYLTPFRCEEQIEYLRALYDIGNEVLILKVGSIENESAYRRYFGL